MKVYIGKYRDRWVSRVHERYMDKEHGWNWPEYGQKGLSTVHEPFKEVVLRNLEDALQWVYNHTINLYLDRYERKVKVRIDKQDTWGMDHTLAPIILPMLKQLKETKHGAPNVDIEDVPKELRPSEEWIKRYNRDGETDPYFFKRWDWVMDEMIWAFEQKCRDDWMEDFYYNKWDREGAKAHQERMSNGFRLFGKYYESLWD
jgi:hypothetical protein